MAGCSVARFNELWVEDLNIKNLIEQSGKLAPNPDQTRREERDSLLSRGEESLYSFVIGGSLSACMERKSL